MDKLLGIVGGVPQLASRNDDDWVDRICHRYTTSLIMAFAAIVSTKQYVGNPINCWCAAEYKKSHCQYAESYCWVKNTYYLGDKTFEDRNDHIVKYYQWVPIILLCQALLFYLPIVFWRSLNGRSGVDVDNIVETSETLQNCNAKDKKEKTLASITLQMDRFLSSNKEYYAGLSYNIKHCISKLLCYSLGYRKGNYLVTLYLFFKFVFIVNAIVQFLAIGYFMDDNYYSYGIDFFLQSWSGSTLKESPIFPRVTFCDFYIRKLGGNIHPHTVQCVLSINLFNEIVFLLLWWWLIFVIIILIHSFIKWSLGIFSAKGRTRFVLKHLQLLQRINESNKESVEDFVLKYLKKDGWFITSLVAKNTNTITAADFLTSLWDTYLLKKEDLEKKE